jgi:hypothetical protein
MYDMILTAIDLSKLRSPAIIADSMKVVFVGSDMSKVLMTRVL